MLKKHEKKDVSGFLYINKPTGITSHDAIDRLRKITGIKKIGHAGTLDPFASGVLIVAVGREATKKIDQYVKLDKDYLATLRFGVTTDTYDLEGKIIDSAEVFDTVISEDEIKKVLEKFKGKQKQKPPMFSAKKVGGKKLYELARKGIEIERKETEIEIYRIELVKYEWPSVKLRVICSSGTYVRALAHDIGQKLGCGAHLTALERIGVGDVEINKCVKLEDLDEGNWSNYISP